MDYRCTGTLKAVHPSTKAKSYRAIVRCGLMAAHWSLRSFRTKSGAFNYGDRLARRATRIYTAELEVLG